MANFDKLRKLDISSNKTVTFPFVHIVGVPKLEVKPATESNKEYFNALIRRARKNTKAIQAGAINAGMLEETRNEDKELYAKFIIVGWSNMEEITDDTKFTADNLKQFLDALPADMFDELRRFCSDPVNFRDYDDLDAETTAKN